MGAGVDAVKRNLVSGFGSIKFREMYDHGADSTALAFDCDGQKYAVRISQEFDDDFPSGPAGSLADLIAIVRASPGKTVLVKTRAMSQI
jgi:hypothetical protein